MSQDILNEINSLIKKYFNDQKEEEFIPGKTKIPLAIPQFGSEEVIESLESLISTWVTMGKKVKTFESQFRDYVGQKEALMVNSGSSANLLGLASFNFNKGSEIITPSLTFSTTVSPIYQLGLIPHFIDVEENYFTAKIDQIEIDHYH